MNRAGVTRAGLTEHVWEFKLLGSPDPFTLYQLGCWQGPHATEAHEAPAFAIFLFREIRSAKSTSIVWWWWLWGLRHKLRPERSLLLPSLSCYQSQLSLLSFYFVMGPWHKEACLVSTTTSWGRWHYPHFAARTTQVQWGFFNLAKVTQLARVRGTIWTKTYFPPK